VIITFYIDLFHQDSSVFLSSESNMFLNFCMGFPALIQHTALYSLTFKSRGIVLYTSIGFFR